MSQEKNGYLTMRTFLGILSMIMTMLIAVFIAAFGGIKDNAKEIIETTANVSHLSGEVIKTATRVDSIEDNIKEIKETQKSINNKLDELVKIWLPRKQ